MDSSFSKVPVTIRATLTSYILLCGIWIILASGYLILSYRSQGENLESGAIIAGGVGLLWGIWLRGFRISLSNKTLEYRDGFYRSSRLHISQIVKIKSEWVAWGVLGRKIRIPRMAVIAQDEEESILINPKPFGRNELRLIREMLERGANAVEGDLR
jgi:hypothetical protein